MNSDRRSPDRLKKDQEETLEMSKVLISDGKWLLGIWVCQFFTTSDILLCTSSILNLCAIAIDRFVFCHQKNL